MKSLINSRKKLSVARTDGTNITIENGYWISRPYAIEYKEDPIHIPCSRVYDIRVNKVSVYKNLKYRVIVYIAIVLFFEAFFDKLIVGRIPMFPFVDAFTDTLKYIMPFTFALIPMNNVSFVEISTDKDTYLFRDKRFLSNPELLKKLIAN